MSNTYPDLNFTNFPDSTDESSFLRMQDPTITDTTLINQYKAFITANDITSANNLLIANPSLQTKIFNASQFNKFRDGLIAIERMWSSNIHGYIQTKQDEFQAEIDKFTDKYNYNPTTQYYKKNFVHYNGIVYICIQNSLGNLPTNTLYFTQLSIKGDTGYGVGLQFRNQFVISTQYHVDDLIVYNGNLYRCKVDSINHYPSDENYWEFFLSAYGENLNNLQTTDKSGLVPAINEIKNTSNATTLDGHDSTYFAVASTSVQTSDVVTIATANKILKLNNDSKLPASITGDANSINGHDSDYFDNKINTLAGISGLNEKANKSALDTVETSLNNHKADNSHKYARYFLMMGGV